MKCDECGKFYQAGTGERWPVTQADYLFGDPGPFYSCPRCVAKREPASVQPDRSPE